MLVALLTPASGNSAQQYLTACLRSDLLPGGCGSGRLEANFKATVSPERLPRHEFAPVGLTVSGTIGTEGDGHPSALREAVVVVDEGIKVDTEGLPTCSRRRLESLSDSPVGTCRDAIVGRGIARIGLASSEEKLKVPLTLFNGGTSAGMTRLFAHGAAAATGADLVAVGQIRQRGQGLEATWKIPRILDGDGSLLSFRIEVKRAFAASGRRHSYLSGSCPDGEFQASVPELTFFNEAHIPGVASQTVLKGALSLPCALKHRLKKTRPAEAGRVW